MGCGCGVLLPKTGPRGLFWGCSMYKKRGCKFTKHYGPPYDRDAIVELEKIEAKEQIEALYRESIQDPFEREWLNECQCDGAKDLNTFECYMRSDGGCGFLPECPECGEALFLKEGGYGKFWGCSRFKMGCKFHISYIPHSSPKSVQEKETEDGTFSPPASLDAKHIGIEKNKADAMRDVTTRASHPQDPKSPLAEKKSPACEPPLTPEQKERIAKNRAEAFARLKARSILSEHNSSDSPSVGVKHSLVTPHQDENPKKKRVT